jgi:Domain of unknown function (DUF4129)
MSRFLAKLRALPPNLRWGGLLALVLMCGLGIWFFFLRGGGGPLPPAPPQRPALGKTIALSDYQAAIATALSDVQEARAAEDAARKPAIQQAIAELERVEGASITEVAGGPAIAEADNTRLLQELALDAPNLEAVESALAFLSESLESGPAGHLGAVEGTASGAESGALLAGVLANPIYDYTRSLSPLEQLARWIASLTGDSDPDNVLSRLFMSVLAGIAVGSMIFLLLDKYVPNRWARLGLSALGGLLAAGIFYAATGALDVVFQVITAVGLAVAAVAVGLLLAGLNQGSAPGSVHPVSDLASVLGMSAQEARRRADEAAAQADFRSAIRYRCLAVLLALDEAGMLDFDRTATNREYLFRAPGPLHDALQLLLTRFEEIWYGNSDTNAEEWTQYTARAAAIESQITPQTRPKAA